MREFHRSSVVKGRRRLLKVWALKIE